MRAIICLLVFALILIALTPWVFIFWVATGTRRGAYIIIRLWARTLITVFGVKIKTTVLGDVDWNRPVLFMSNHLSMADIPILMTGIPAGLSFVSKKSLERIPFLGWSMKMGGMVFIDRGNTQQAINALNEAAKSTPENMNVIIFPEGTRNRDNIGHLNPIKKGGFLMAKAFKRPIQPVAIIGSQQVQKGNSFALYPAFVELRLGNPIPVSEDSDVEELMRLYRDEIERILAVEEVATENVISQATPKTEPN